MQTQSFAERRPYLFSVVLAFLILVIYIASGTLVTILQLPVLALYLIANLALVLLAAGLLSWLGWWRAAGFQALQRSSDLLLFWLPAAVVLLNLSGGIRVAAPLQIALFAGLACLSGFAEEAFYRGLMLRALLPRGPWLAAIVTALIFGAMHGLNALAGSNPGMVVLQIGYASAIGFGYAAVLIRTRSIWPLVALHALTNLFGFLAGGEVAASSAISLFDIIVTLATMLAFSLYGMLLLRGATPTPGGVGRISQQPR